MKEYAKAIWFNKPNNAPKFVIGSLSISKKNFIEWLSTQETNEKGYVHLSILDSKTEEGKPYIALDNYKK